MWMERAQEVAFQKEGIQAPKERWDQNEWSSPEKRRAISYPTKWSALQTHEQMTLPRVSMLHLHISVFIGCINVFLCMEKQLADRVEFIN